MPLSPRWRATGTRRSAGAAGPWRRSAARCSAGRRSGRGCCGGSGNSCAAMSARVVASAVAVKATTWTGAERVADARRAGGIPGGNHGPIARRSAPRRWRGAGRRALAQPRDRSPFIASRSGERKSRRSSPASSRPPAPRGLVSAGRASSASRPRRRARRAARTWSRISAISGETTTVSPPSTTAGSW